MSDITQSRPREKDQVEQGVIDLESKLGSNVVRGEHHGMAELERKKNYQFTWIEQQWRTGGKAQSRWNGAKEEKWTQKNGLQIQNNHGTFTSALETAYFSIQLHLTGIIMYHLEWSFTACVWCRSHASQERSLQWRGRRVQVVQVGVLMGQRWCAINFLQSDVYHTYPFRFRLAMMYFTFFLALLKV